MSEPLLDCILLGGPEFIIVVEGKAQRFEYDRARYGGPMPITIRGNERRLSSGHLFWRAVTWWIQQGEQMNSDGTCAWAYPPDPLAGAVRVGPRTYVSKEIAATLRRRTEGRA